MEDSQVSLWGGSHVSCARVYLGIKATTRTGLATKIMLE